MSKMEPFKVSYISKFQHILIFELEKTTHLQESIDPALLQSMREGNPLKLTGIP